MLLAFNLSPLTFNLKKRLRRDSDLWNIETIARNQKVRFIKIDVS